MPTDVTVSRMMGETGRPRHVIVYLLNKLGFEPTCRIGVALLYPPAALEAVKAELASRPERRRREVKAV